MSVFRDRTEEAIREDRRKFLRRLVGGNFVGKLGGAALGAGLGISHVISEREGLVRFADGRSAEELTVGDLLDLEQQRLTLDETLRLPVIRLMEIAKKYQEARARELKLRADHAGDTLTAAATVGAVGLVAGHAVDQLVLSRRKVLEQILGISSYAIMAASVGITGAIAGAATAHGGKSNEEITIGDLLGGGGPNMSLETVRGFTLGELAEAMYRYEEVLAREPAGAGKRAKRALAGGAIGAAGGVVLNGLANLAEREFEPDGGAPPKRQERDVPQPGLRDRILHPFTAMDVADEEKLREKGGGKGL